MNKILVSGIVGGVVFFLAGYLIWGLALAEVVAANSGIQMADPPNFLFIGIGCLAGGIMVSYIFGKWASISTFQTGMKGGAILGVLIALTSGFMMLGSSVGATSLNMVLIDTVASAVLYALVGGTVGWMLGRDVPALEAA